MLIMRLPHTFAFTLAATLALAASAVGAAELRVLLANAVKEPLEEIVGPFQRKTGHKVRLVGAGTEAAMKRVQDGEAFDVVVIGSDRIDQLLAAGKLVPGSRRDFARSGVGVAVRAGLPKPDIGSRDALRDAVLASRRIALSSGPSGGVVERMFQSLGIADTLKDRVVKTPSGVQVAQVVARGDADLGFQQVSELLHAKGIDYLGPLPPALQSYTIYAGALHPAASQPDAARALLQFITGPAAVGVLKHHGLDPG